MTQHLLILTLGPVQEFIEQARRTRDLWFGSHLLSELSRTAAWSLANEPRAELVFPALRWDDPELQPCWSQTRGGISRLRDGGQPPLNIANKIVVILPSEVDPRDAAQRARRAVRAQWRRVGDFVRDRCRTLLARGIDAAWEEQIDGVLEHVAAWQAFEPGGYAQARREVEQAIAGRKQLREFAAWQHLRGAVPRSSLDGGRETVLARPGKHDPPRPFGIRAGEQLDAVSLCKRAGGQPEQFVATPNLALARWLEAAAEAAPGAMERLRRACKDAGINPVQRGAPWRDALPFYADVVLEAQCAQALAEGGTVVEAAEAAQWFRTYVLPVLRVMPEPHGYLAALVADGDFMGKAIEQLDTPAEHRALSRALAGFAGRARAIVEQHRGQLVYAGGDDVLALVCPTDALACAEALRDAFAACMEAFTRTHPLDRVPTLSVGLGLAHRTEGLGDLLELGRRAERLAKDPPQPGVPGRNALAIIVTPHSGQERTWRASWDERPVTRLARDMELELPLGKVHAIEDVRRRLAAVSADALRCEVARILAHGSDGAEPFTPDEVGLVLPPDATAAELDLAVRRFVDRWLVAEVFARAERCATPRSPLEARS